MKASRKQQADAAPTTIGFRLDDESRKILGSRAKRMGISPHELARSYLLEKLHEKDDRRALNDTLGLLLEHNDSFCRAVALAFEAVLAATGKISQKDAHAWAQENFNFD